MHYQVVIVVGGPAAHNAGLALGRSRKRVLICDEGKPRNRVAKHSHTLFTRDGTPPLELRQIAINQLATYDTVEFLRGRVTLFINCFCFQGVPNQVTQGLRDLAIKGFDRPPSRIPDRGRSPDRCLKDRDTLITG